jgi:hypothetical protein
MSDKFNQLIELLIAEDEEKAQELFHEIVVERSRSIYENLIDEETVDEEEEVAEDEAVEESDFDEELGGDAADDMIDDIEADEQGLAVEDDEADDEEIEDRVVDLEDALDELKAEFEKIMGGDEEEGPEMDMDMDMDMDDEMDMEMGDEEAGEDDEDEMEESLVREYSEKVNAKNVEEGDGASGPVAGKNDMGGKAVDPTGEEKGGSAPKATVQTDAADPKGATMSKA